MSVNVGLADRTIRIWVGLAMVLFALVQRDQPYAFLGWLGIIPLLTGIFGWCGLYRLLGISTVRNS